MLKKPIKCPVCSGTGHQGRDHDYEDCGYCHGTGWAENDEVTRSLLQPKENK